MSPTKNKILIWGGTMQKRVIALLLSSAATMVVGYAHAADYIDPYANVWSWSGAYAGAHVGYGTGDKAWHAIYGVSGGQGGSYPQDSLNAANYDVGGMLGGIQAGYNIQQGNIVMGVEAEASWSGINGDGLGGVNTSDRPFSTDVNFLGTFTGRFGVAMDRTLFYGKAGVAVINESHSHTTGAPLVLDGSETRMGAVLGAGVEHAFNERWSVKGEYNYLQFNASDVVLTNGGDQAAFAIDQQLHTFKVGLNYRFTDGGALQERMGGGFDWSGAYAGLHAGYGWGDKAWHGIFGASGGQGGPGNPQQGSLNAANYDVSGILGGVQVGYNVQQGNIVMGVEAEASWSGIDGDGLGGISATDRPFSTDINFLGTLTGRFGVAMDRTLFYGEVGVAIVNEDHSHTTGAPLVLNGSETRMGAVIGAGVEHAINDLWSVKGEYNFIQFNAADVVLSNGGTQAAFAIDQQLHTLKIGVNRRF